MITRASERKFFRVTKVDTGPPNLIGPPSLIGAHAIKSVFVERGADLHLKVGDINIRIQLGPTKNTTIHKIGLNPARGLGEAL